MTDERRTEVEKAAQQGLEARGGAELARALLRQERAAVLATTSTRVPGHPFASLVPFALTRDGEPLLLLSALAQHTRNLGSDPRACLFVHDAAATAKDPRTAARVAILGRVHPVAAADAEEARARYVSRHPESRGLFAMDFSLWALEVDEAQVVGGFAAAGWVSGDEIRGPA